MCSCQLMEQKGYEHLECVIGWLWNRKDVNIQNVFLLVMEKKEYEHLEGVLASYGIERI